MRSLLPIQGALQMGKWRIFEFTLLDEGGGEEDQPEKGTAATDYGFRPGSIDPLAPLQPLVDTEMGDED